MKGDRAEMNVLNGDMEELRAFGLPRILVVGCGGAGNNTVNRLSLMGLTGAETLAINTDSQQLGAIEADKKMLIGHRLTRGQGAGGDPAAGRAAAEQARPTLEGIIEGADMVFVTAGLGGGTGTGVAPVVAAVAREKGAVVVGMVTTPFHLERSRILVAEHGLEAMRSSVDTLMVLDNNRLLEVAPHLPLEKAFSVVDVLISDIIMGIAETVTQPSLINLDYADVRTIMGCGGASSMIVGEGSTRDPAKVIRSALNHPLLEVDPRGAKGCLLHVTGGEELTLKEVALLASTLTGDLDPSANVIWGARIQKSFGSRVRVVAIITGVMSPQLMHTRIPRHEPTIDVIPRPGQNPVRRGEATWLEGDARVAVMSNERTSAR